MFLGQFSHLNLIWINFSALVFSGRTIFLKLYIAQLCVLWLTIDQAIPQESQGQVLPSETIDHELVRNLVNRINLDQIL